MGFAPVERTGVRTPPQIVWRAFLFFFGLLAITSRAEKVETNSVLVVVGAPGEAQFGEQFEKWAELWEKATARAAARFTRIGPSGAEATNNVVKTAASSETEDANSDRRKVEQFLAREQKEGPAELWVVFLGHGTFDGKEARLNLRGPDISGAELATWLAPFRRPIALLFCASASGPLTAALSSSNRVVITATKSGFEQSFSRFGGFFAEAVADPAADLDKDGQTSLLESFLSASRRVTEFYESAGRLASEHALLDDNGDGLGTPADWFRGVQPVKKATNGTVDGLRAHQFHLIRSVEEQARSAEWRAQRDDLELKIGELRANKADTPEKEYYERLEEWLLKLARLYEASSTNKSVSP